MGTNAPRRDYGRGSIYQRGKVWWVQYRVSGERVCESSKSTKRSDAVRFLDQRMREAAMLGLPQRTLVGELLDLLVRDYALNGKRVDTTMRSMEKYIRPYFALIEADRMTTDHVNGYIDIRLKQGMAKSTLNREMSLLRRAFAIGMAMDPPKVRKNLKIPRFKEDNVRKGFFTDEEYEKLRAELPGHLRPILAFGYFTGCRRGEILSLKWDQVDLDRGLARLEPGTTKNDEARVVPLISELKQDLAALKAERDEFYPHVPWVFTAAGVRVANFSRAWKSACKRAGVDRLFHDCRRSGVRNLVRSGVCEKVAMKISGHKTRSVFERYNITNEEDLLDAAAKLEAARK